MEKKENGITLIALVVTIIVLLILAGISLNLIGGANGILSQAQKAVDATKLAQLKESLELANAEKLMDKYAEGEYVQDLYDYIKGECEKKTDKTVETSNGKYWLDNDDDMHYESKEPQAGAELEKDQNGNPAIKSTENNKPDDGEEHPGGDTEKTVPDLTTSNTDFEYSPKGWTNGSVAIKAIPKNIDTTGFTIQTSKDSENWEDTDTQIFTENGILHVRLVKGTEYGKAVTEQINNIDTTKPEVTEIMANLNSITIRAKDKDSGIVGYAVTDSENQPEKEDFTSCSNTKELAKTITEITGTTHYVWVIDEAGNISESKLAISDIPTIPALTNDDITFTFSGNGWTNQPVTITATPKMDITGYTIQISTNGTDWEDGNQYEFTENGTLYVTLRNDAGQRGESTASKSVDNIDTTKPEITEVVAETNKFVFKAKDEGSGLAGYEITETNEQPTKFTPIENSPKEFQKLIDNLKNDKTYYVWVKDQAGNVSESGAKVNLSAVEGATNTNLAVGSTTWEGTNATVTFSTTTQNQIQWCTTQSTNDSDWTTGTSATVSSGTTIYVRLWDGTNGGTSYMAHKPVLTYQVKYNANGGSGTMANSTHEYGTTKALTANAFSKVGYTFGGWAITANGTKGYDNQASVTNLSSTNGYTVNLYAVWTANTYTVVYNGNGATGGSTTSSTHTYGTAKNLTANGFTRTNYSFEGWATSANGAKVYNNSQNITNLSATNGATVTLYAKWKENLKPATSVLTSSNYGDAVNYSAGGETDWLIFLNQGGHVYLIPKLTIQENGYTLGTGVTQSTSKGHISCSSKSDFLTWMNSETYWSNYASGYSGATAKGGPTLEQWIDSWNSKGYEKVSATVTEYFCGAPVAATIQRADGKKLSSSTTLVNSGGKDDQLYFPYVGTTSYGYYLISSRYGSDSSNTTVWHVMPAQHTISYGGTPYTIYGFRPLVCLPTDAKMKWNGAAWDLAY